MLENILRSDLLENNMRVVVREVFDRVSTDAASTQSPLHTPGNAKTLDEFYDLVRRAIDDYEKRAGTPAGNKIYFSEESPDAKTQSEAITVSLVKREPGTYSQGSPFQGDVKNLRPILREKGRDPANPSYQYATLGYWHDNLVRFTCWAKTNKAANKRASWFEQMMEEYTWWFRMQGVSRVLFWGRQEDNFLVVDDNKWYGRPFQFYVRTETLYTFSEKTLEEIIINLNVDAGGT